MAVNNYKKLWFSTDELISKFKPSLSNYFDVYIPGGNWSNISSEAINFLAYEAVLPGNSYELAQVYGDRQGRIEQYATRRIYAPVDVSFYIDYDYEVLRFFEDWQKQISPNIGPINNSYVKFNYPNTYETSIIITKFERNFRSPNQRLVENGVYQKPKSYVEYTLRNAFPINLISVPVSYEGANVLRTTVTFNYDVYNFKRVNDTVGTDDDPGSGTIGPGGDSPLFGSFTNPNSPLSQTADRALENPNDGFYNIPK